MHYIPNISVCQVCFDTKHYDKNVENCRYFVINLNKCLKSVNESGKSFEFRNVFYIGVFDQELFVIPWFLGCDLRHLRRKRRGIERSLSNTLCRNNSTFTSVSCSLDSRYTGLW